MIRVGVLGTARVVPYGLLQPAKETRGVHVMGSRPERRRRPQSLLHAKELSADSAPMRRYWNATILMPCTSRFRHCFTPRARATTHTGFTSQ
jgi:hypothetical protein